MIKVQCAQKLFQICAACVIELHFSIAIRDKIVNKHIVHMIKLMSEETKYFT